MSSERVLKRIAGIQKQLIAAYEAGSDMSSASKGAERDLFLHGYLQAVLPTGFRFGTGDIVDQHGAASGQVDIVIENPFVPSLPIMGGYPRLYLTEGVAAAVEVKSDVQAQWSQVEAKAAKIASLASSASSMTFGAFGGTITTRNPEGLSVGGRALGGGLPFFVAGYRGFANVRLDSVESVALKMDAAGVDALLVVESGLFVSSARLGGVYARGPHGLWAFICAVTKAAQQVRAIEFDPLSYVFDAA
ncbi:DUF6602 domain-containing protein [Variovorax sp. UMC13]|uniref:DUF6602 domain-containing protein n=1 Tax=Variovorax sp. UMC13 TaxID=1862326 RepID=UPI0016044399|nr:DUF6602 domain-containing protein [Variovorax sp. UMC13]